MKIHLIKDGDVSNETFTEVFDLLNAISGPIQFFCDNDNLVDFNEDDYLEDLILTQDKFEKGIKNDICYSISEISSSEKPIKNLHSHLVEKPQSGKPSLISVIITGCLSKLTMMNLLFY